MTKEEQEILSLKDPEKSYYYCFYNKKTANIKEHEKIILESKDAWYAYLFARDIPNANIKELEKVVLESKNVHYAYFFARDIPGANIKELEKVILEYKNAEHAYLFARDIEGANLELFKDILENSKYKEEFANLYSEYKSNSSSNSNFGSEKSEPRSSQCDKNISKENKQMADSNMDFFKDNLIEGAYSGVAVVAVENVKKGLLAAAKAAGADEVSLGMASMFLDSPAGKSLLSIAVGSGVRFIPADIVQQNPHLQKVAEKCIQNAGSEGAQYAFKLATSYIMPALLGAVKDSPQLNMLNSINAADKVRVPAPENKEQAPDTEPSNVVEGAFNKASRAGLK